MAVLPRRPKGPPLNALRAFEAAARLGGFVSAAEELSVTPGAVSQHIKAVEAWADVPLFRRNAQGVELTSSGRQLASEFTLAFDHLAAATQSLRNLSPSVEIHIAALPSVAQLWLPARLGRIREARPDLKFSVTALETPPSLSRELFDLSVFFTVPDGAADQIVVAEDVIFPVCSPKLVDSFRFDSIPLLHDQTWHDDWRLWSEATGADVADPTKGPKYSLYGLAVEEAKSGAGALMAHACLVEQALRDGHLCRMSAEECATGQALVINLPHPSRRRPETDEITVLLQDSKRSGQG
ncbi:LysR family transcriptional regulator [Ruegeria sp. Ofav3-42]|uniref:LysR family transcriptional regulator n=1 Tax=Ruegeria sp. Ofav3-42 TaxID=2917759 RepID=UPI001EF4D680|nr:LysR family transcriptional regulator [Ruegeria sp. Ofav3-42]MCG7520901.1 LysR family transcriptional regulator [Ruegeria sp. Ofav3-42]